MARPRLFTDEQILSTTRACVRELGAHVSLDAVAAELGVTGPALLKRFGNRQELLLRALRPPQDLALIERFLEGPDARPLRVQLGERFDELWAFFDEMLPCVAALRESGIPHDKIFEGKNKNPLRMLLAISKWLGLAHQQGLADVPAPESVATAILGAVQARAFTAHIAKIKYSTRSNREYLEDVVDLFSKALAVKARRTNREVA